MAEWASITVRVILAIISFCGIVLNSLSFYVLLKCRIGSKLTTSLMRSQLVVDGYACVIIFISKLVGQDYVTPWMLLNEILCYAWFRDNLFWLGCVMSVHNIVCISFDRLIAVTSPIFYKLHQFALIVGCYIYLVSMSLFLFVPNFFLRRFVNSTCKSEYALDNKGIAEFFTVQSYFWMFCAYILPGCFIITCHAVVIRFVYNWPSNSQEDNSEQRTHNRGKVKMLFLTTATMASMLLILHSYEAVRYLLANIGVISYASGSPQQQIGIGLIILTCTLNPCVLIGTTSTLRKFAQKLISRVFCPKNETRSVSSTSVSMTDL